MFVGGTLAWKSLGQTARNEKVQGTVKGRVELVKREKKPDGTKTETLIPGAEFYLYDNNGKQKGGKYTTDESGRITVSLEPGEYYFEEAHPSFGYDFDVKDGERVTRYTFTVPQNGGTVPVEAWNRRATGTLTVTKTVKVHPDGEPDEAQRIQPFEFTVTFSDKGNYPCQIDGVDTPLTPGEDGDLHFSLCHEQQAVFSGVPVGVWYKVTETPVEGYAAFSDNSQGTITPEGRTAGFANIWNYEQPAGPFTLEVTKKLEEGVPPREENRTFRFAITVNGEKVKEFTLEPRAHGGVAQVTFTDLGLNFGDSYTVEELDPEGYILTTDKVTGTIALEMTRAQFINAEPRPQVTVSGEKTWIVDEAHLDKVPASIRVQLWDGGRLVEEKTVDREQGWRYDFTAPKYDWEGKKIAYTIRETPVDYFAPEVRGYDIVNTYVDPVTDGDPPIRIEKKVEGQNAPEELFRFVLQAEDGAPLPNGKPGSSRTYDLRAGEWTELGEFTFRSPGTYVYTVREKKDSTAGWTYDETRYTITYRVELNNNGKLEVHRTLTQVGGGEVTDNRLTFRNRYTPPAQPTPGGGNGGGGDDDGGDTVRISGKKRWVNSGAPEGAQPESIVLLVYADGEVVHRQKVTARNGWRYSLTFPRRDKKGHRITYTIGEEPVPGYELKVDGWNLVNTYVGIKPTPTPMPIETVAPTPTVKESTTPEPTPTVTETGAPTPASTESAPPPQGASSPPPSVPKTGDTGELPIWLFVTLSGVLGLLACLGYVYWQKHRYVGKRLKK